MSTAPFSSGPESVYDPQAQSIAQTQLPIVRQEEFAAATSNSEGLDSKVAQKVVKVREEGLQETEKFKRPQDQAK